MARIASLAVHGDGPKLLSEVVLSACDDRRIIVSELWLKIKKDLVCNALWQPSFEFSFNEVRHIRPNAHCNDQLSPASIAATWHRIVSHLKTLFLSISQLEPSPPENHTHTVWVRCICSPSLKIPMSERAVVMWIWLLWSSNTIPFFISAQVKVHPPPAEKLPPSLRGVQERMRLLTTLHNERLITSSEFKKKRLCILNSL